MVTDLDLYTINYELAHNFDFKIFIQYNIIPIEEYDIFILLASTTSITDTTILEELFHKPIKFVFIPQKALDFEILHFDYKYKLFKKGQKALINKDNFNIDESHIAHFLEELFTIAISLKTSDIHLEALKNALIIRLRIDGILVQFFRFEIELYPIVSSSLKLFSKLDISQKRLPQNGRFSKSIKENDYDFRISFLPTISGESIVIRILDNKKAFLGLQHIGFCEDTYKSIKKNINFSQGMILITGATGSGKTTTMYSILNELDKKKKKIITIEDPIEYNIDGVMQVPINDEIGLTYETVLKNILRQDPDVIMIGEIRDESALRIAIQASLTGHLVIATLHTNDAIKTINRLLDLGAKPYLIASVLRLIVSQKLIRVLCNNCKKKVIIDGVTYYENVGCPKCNLSGYTGRTIITEYFEFDETISKMVNEKVDISNILSYANYKSINENAYSKVLDGTTSLNEFLLHEI
ncbi:MAG: GspE/PulE family protein [Epsilonproteobacteria bacterium]|nr:GspE/PulE family protein [Campylobacterota bacterium]